MKITNFILAVIKNNETKFISEFYKLIIGFISCFLLFCHRFLYLGFSMADGNSLFSVFYLVLVIASFIFYLFYLNLELTDIFVYKYFMYFINGKYHAKVLKIGFLFTPYLCNVSEEITGIFGSIKEKTYCAEELARNAITKHKNDIKQKRDKFFERNKLSEIENIRIIKI